MTQLASIPRATKLKLFCRFNGEFHPKPPYNSLRYVGGETKVVTVEKNLTFLKLATKLCQLCPNLKSFCVKYKLVWSDSDSEKDPPLVSIECDDDVKCMVEEFDEKVKLCGQLGNNLRIWLFVEKKSGFCGWNVNGNKCGLGFDSPLIDLNSELSDECCGSGKVSGKLSRDESFGERVKCPLNPRDENLLSKRNGFVHCVSRQSKVDCNGLSSSCIGSVCGGVNGKQELWINGDIGEVLVDNLNKEKSMCSCRRVSEGNQNCIRHCRFGLNEGRNRQICPYLLRREKNVVHIGKENHRAFRNGGNNLQCGVAYSVDLLYNLSLSSSKEMGSPALSSLGCSGAANALLKSEIRPLNIIDDGKVRKNPKVEKPAAITSDHVSLGGLIIEKDCMPEEEIQQDPPSGLIVDEQVETKESIKGSKVIGGISNDLAAFYTHLSAKELQAIKYSDLEFVKELGTGTYGTVYHGKWKGSDIAIKKLKPSCFSGGSVEEDRLVADFWKEAHILGQLHHPNIVAFYGVVTDGPANNLAMVTEYMINGSLRQVLKRKDRTIDRRKRLIIAMDAAFGMEYLHEKNIVHFDLKSHNLLVNMKDPQRPICKIGDLGLSKIKKRTLVSGGVRGTIPWMAPELLNSKNMVMEKVDVYSFGVVMWELLTGEEPYANLRSEEIIAGIMKGTLRPEIPSWIDPTWRSLMVRCWSSNPDERPAFSEITKELRTMAMAVNIK